jgi:hypothetical protein
MKNGSGNGTSSLTRPARDWTYGAAAIPTFAHTNVDWKQHHHDGKESAGR